VPPNPLSLQSEQNCRMSLAPRQRVVESLVKQSARAGLSLRLSRRIRPKLTQLHACIAILLIVIQMCLGLGVESVKGGAVAPVLQLAEGGGFAVVRVPDC